MQVDMATYYLKAFDKYTEELATTFLDFDKKTFNSPINEGKWSPGQYVEHLILAEAGTNKLMNRPGAVETGRKADGLCAKLEKGILQTPHLVEAHKAIRPEAQIYNKVDLLDRFIDTRAELRVSFEFVDDIAEIVDWEHPIFGKLTKCEWIYFTGLHGERHRRQVVKALS